MWSSFSSWRRSSPGALAQSASPVRGMRVREPEDLCRCSGRAPANGLELPRLVRGQSPLAGSERAHERLGLSFARRSERLAAPLALSVAGHLSRKARCLLRLPLEHCTSRSALARRTATLQLVWLIAMTAFTLLALARPGGIRRAEAATLLVLYAGSLRRCRRDSFCGPPRLLRLLTAISASAVP
jgi:hypothetical protein